jgi:hypothetical protein
MTEPKRFPWLALILGIGCVGVLCIGFLVIDGGVAFFLTQRTASSSVPEPVITVPVEILEPTVVPTSVIEPTLAKPTVVEPNIPSASQTGEQHLDDHSLFDDFSSDALGWPVFDDGKTIIQYENETYSFQIAETDYVDWAYFPVDFVSYEIWFDVHGLPGQQDGAFGVFCQYQDADNYYYAEFDLQDNSYILAQIVNGEDIPLTKQNSVGQFWYETDAFKSSPEAVNRIGVSCYLDSITLFINDQMVDQVNVQQPFDQPGEAAFFVYTFDFAGPNGYKVYFDNVETWQPVQ